MSTPDTDEIKAGTYELAALQWDQVLSVPGEPFNFKRHRRGDKIKLNVEEARRLVRAGAAVEPGARERAAYALAVAQLDAAKAALPPEPEPVTSARRSGSPAEGEPRPVKATDL